MGEEPEVKRMTTGRILAALALLVAPAGIAAAKTADAPVIREAQHLNVNGVDEIWRLQWDRKPHPECTPSVDPSWSTRPCDPFAFGEAGPLSLIRLRNGSEYERLRLTGYFTEDDATGTQATVQKHAPRKEDFDRQDGPTDQEIARRPLVRIMRFRDYDHDGHATEFMLPVANSIGFHQLAIVVGVSAANPHLHVFGTADAPDSALKLGPVEWKALAQGKPRVVSWVCGDHGSDIENDLEFHTSKDGISVTHLHYSCEAGGARGRQLSDDEISKLQHSAE